MGVIKKKPYEISVWEDRLITENDVSYYKEIKLAVIGSDKMESPNRAFDPILTENVNGEKTLTFSLAYRYYDEYTGEIVTNPFYGYLVNERKIKLFYNDEWFEFVIKECEESSTENIFNYTAKELFSLELAKLGYNVTLDTSLNNNQGTIIELAKRVLENTDWEVDEEGSDSLSQYVQEPLYQAKLINNIQVLNLDTNTIVEVNENETIYVFYSFLNNRTTDYVQFIREADRDKFFIDDDNVIKSTNYRILSPVNYTIDSETGQVTTIDGIASIEGTYLNNQGYRLVYKIQTTYDPVMNRTVDIYKMSYGDGAKEIYHFLDYNYTTSDIVISYMTNGSNFQLYEDGQLQGWYNTTPTTSTDESFPVLQTIGTTTYPELNSNNPLILIDKLSQLSGYLELKFNGTLTNNYENTFFNLGFEHSRSIIDHISRGEEFVLRTRYYTANEKHGDLVVDNPTVANGGLGVIVAKYDTVDEQCYTNQDAKDKDPDGTHPSTIKAYKIIPDDIILDFNGDFTLSENIINNGTFNDNYKQYLVDNVIQVPSMAYVYQEAGNDTKYIWDAEQKLYVPKTSATVPFADYYLTTARAQYSFTNEQMNDPKFRMGIFVYIADSELVDKYIYLEDIQLTRCYRDGNDKIVTLGNVPTAISAEAHHYYLKPDTPKTEKEIATYGSLEFLAHELGVNEDTITPVFNEKSEKILSVQASNSNYFNILQDLCETFECWLDIRVAHNDDGSIKFDENYNPIKKIAFKEYAGKDNFAGFKNGINLNGITRTIDSNEIVTKLIVEPVQSEYTDTGMVDIQRARSNPSGQSYILNLSYYLNRGLITDVEQCNQDIDTYNKKIKQINTLINEKEDEYIQATNSLTKIAAQRTTYTALIEEAERHYNEALEDFQKITNWDYDAFVSEYQNIEEWAQAPENEGKNYLENDTVLDVVGEIYVSSVTLNNYTGILTNIDKTYEDLSLKCYGAKEYSISVVFVPGDGAELHPSTQVTIDDYVSGVLFQLTDINGASVLYHTSPNNRIFNISNSDPYKTIKFLQIPTHYSLKYYKRNGDEVTISRDELGIPFQIYDDVADETYNRRFVLVADEEYLETHKGLQAEIDELLEQRVDIEKEFYKKYSRFLQEGTWSSQDYIDSELYYFDALQVSNTSAQPKVSYTIDVLEVSQIDGLENYDFRVGDKTYIEDTDFFGYLYQSVNISDSTEENDEEAPRIITARSPVREEVIVSEVEWHLDEPDTNTITVQNYKTQFEDLFQRISATVQAVQRNEITYPKTSSILDQSGLINSDLLANSLNGIGGVGFALTTNGSVAATEDGLLIRNLLNPANLMRVTSSGIQVSTDGGKNWGTAINAEGISTDVLTAGTINTQKIWLMDGDNPSFRWDKSGLNAYGFDENGNNSYDLKTYVRFDKYGLYGIKNDEDYVASSLSDVRNKAFFGITWDGFFIKNSYTNGEVSITPDDDFVVQQNNKNRIKIGAVEKDSTGAPTKYGINIMNDDGEIVFDTGDDGNVTMTGTINAQAGMFSGAVSVGNPSGTHIVIDGNSDNPTISSSNYSDGAGTGWIIDSNGDATFSNVSVRGAIKTAVFEYEEIQAVGGAFLFRPSSTIKSARYDATEVTEEDDEGNPITFETYYHYDETTGDKVYNDLIVTVEKPLMFTENNWVKLSNYNELGEDPTAKTYGLIHIYKISNVDVTSHEEHIEIIGEDGQPIDETIIIEPTYEITLIGGCAVLDDIDIGNIEGGALIDFGNEQKTQNYGIGINSSDNYVNLPARAISLFETTIHPNDTIKVTYDYQGILGTLPTLPANKVSPIYSAYMKDKQGIFTNNMYIGDKDQYLAFYKDGNGNSQLRLVAKSFEILPDDSDLPIDLGDSVVEQKTQYTLSTSTEENTVEEEWRDTPYEESSGYYLWQRTYVKYAKGRIQYLPTEDGYYMNAGQPGPQGPAGPAGEDAINLVIDSSNGNTFKNNSVNTILSVTIYKGTIIINNSLHLKEIFGNTAYLQWYWKRIGENDFHPISIDDSMLSNDGFNLTLTPDKVDVKVVFQCEIKTIGD